MQHWSSFINIGEAKACPMHGVDYRGTHMYYFGFNLGRLSSKKRLGCSAENLACLFSS
jgi:hypothetical protein